MSTSSNPPTPRRCRRILAAHHLHCQDLSLQQIADRMGCARSTAHSYLRDFRLHRDHILRTVAADRLADQVHLLGQIETEPDQHRRAVAATRELRLLLLNLPDIKEHDERPPQQAPTYPCEQDWETGFDADGHLRYIGGPGDGDCLLNCPKCLDEFNRRRIAGLDQPGSVETEQDQSSQNPEKSGPIETNLDKSEHLNGEFPVPSKEFPPISPNSRPKPAVPRRKPVRPDDPFAITTIGTIVIEA